jgi:CBS domain-containing protein
LATLIFNTEGGTIR